MILRKISTILSSRKDEAASRMDQQLRSGMELRLTMDLLLRSCAKWFCKLLLRMIWGRRGDGVKTVFNFSVFRRNSLLRIQSLNRHFLNNCFKTEFLKWRTFTNVLEVEPGTTLFHSCNRKSRSPAPASSIFANRHLRLLPASRSFAPYSFILYRESSQLLRLLLNCETVPASIYKRKHFGLKQEKEEDNREEDVLLGDLWQKRNMFSLVYSSSSLMFLLLGES